MGLIKKTSLSSSRLTGRASSSGSIKFSLAKSSSPQVAAAIVRAIERANQRIAADVKIALDAAMRSEVWQLDSGAADIYDTGELLESGTVTVSSDGVTIAYSAPYAALVHFGGYISPYGDASSRIYLPARPWVDAVLKGGGPVQSIDIGRYYDEEIRREFL